MGGEFIIITESGWQYLYARKYFDKLRYSIDNLRLEDYDSYDFEGRSEAIKRIGFDYSLSEFFGLLTMQDGYNFLGFVATKVEVKDQGEPKEDIRKRFEVLNKKYGGKAAWPLILQELGLPEKLGFKIPPFVVFELDFLKDLVKAYDDATLLWKTKGLKEKEFDPLVYGMVRGDVSREEFNQFLLKSVRPC